MESWEIWFVSGVFVAYALVSRLASRWLITAPMVFIGLGFVLSADVTGAVQLDVEDGAVEFLTELTLAVILFVDASRLNVHRVRKEYGFPLRLLAIGLPLAVAAGGLLTLGLFPALGLTVAALVGAVLAPTDAALGQPVVADPAVPTSVRQALNVESGLNDGLALPFVTILLAILAQTDRSVGYWVGYLAEQIGYGSLAGVATGALGAWLLVRACDAGWVDPIFGQIAVLLIPFMAASGANVLGGNALMAAFTAGVSFGSVAKADTDRLSEYAEDSGQMLAAIAFFLFGNILFAGAYRTVSWRVIVCALAILTVGRMVPVALAMIRSGAAKETVVFIGWFGPRGLASIVFGLMVAESELVFEGSPELSVIGWTVVLSVVLHGISAGPGARLYGRWWTSQSTEEQETMVEATPVSMSPVRWSARPWVGRSNVKNEHENETEETRYD